MSLNIANVLRALPGLRAHHEQQIRDGLDSVAADAQAILQSTTAHGDITGATRASYRAYAVGPGCDESGEVADGVTAVSRLNPGAEALRDYSLPATFGLILTGFTNYLPKLQFEYGGAKAALEPTLQIISDEATQAAARGR